MTNTLSTAAEAAENTMPADSPLCMALSSDSMRQYAHDIVWRLGEITAKPDLAQNIEMLQLGYRLSTVISHVHKNPDAEIIQKIREAMRYLENLPDYLYAQKDRFISSLRDMIQDICAEEAA